ncbi:hypothetical protein KCU85_g7541, partial [Aureobasidium melanogenum]
MRFSIVTIASAAVAAAGTNAIDVAEIPGYEPIPKAATNKYSQDAPSAILDFATGSFEPTYMPAEDLKPSSIQARSVTSTSATASSSTPVPDEPADDSYEAFVLWMSARLTQEVPEKAEHSHVARSVAPSPSAKFEASADGPADDTYEGFVTWMESRYPKEFSEQVKQKINARDAEQHTTTSSITTATPSAAASITGPVDDTYEAFVAWMDSRYPKEFSEQVKQKINARDVASSQATTTASTTSITTTTTVAAATGADPADESYEEFARWMNSRFCDEYPAEDHHELNARSVDTHETLQGNGHEMPDWSHARSEEVEHRLQARSAEEENNGVPSDFEYESGSDVHAASENEYPYLEETFEEFLARQGYSPEQYAQEFKPSESHEEEPKPQVAVSSKPSVSEVAASPAAAPTPKPTSAVTSSATTSTSASQYSGQMSETSTVSSSSATNVQARSVSSHYRFRHHSHSAYASNSGTASTSTSSATSSTTTSRKGFFNLPW